MRSWSTFAVAVAYVCVVATKCETHTATWINLKMRVE